MIGDDLGHLSGRLLEEVTAVDDAARAGDWSTVLEADPRDRLNVWRPGSSTCATPMHHAAAQDVDAELVTALVNRGAWRTLRTVGGRRPVDIARARRAKDSVADALEPAPVRPVPEATLALWQHHVGVLIRQVAAPVAGRYELRIPELSVLTEMPEGGLLWFPVPGMSGGFRLELTGDGVLVSCSSRVVEGSDRRHLITDAGAEVLGTP